MLFLVYVWTSLKPSSRQWTLKSQQNVQLTKQKEVWLQLIRRETDGGGQENEWVAILVRP